MEERELLINGKFMWSIKSILEDRGLVGWTLREKDAVETKIAKPVKGYN
jgi:hypothetical protein